MTKVSDLLRESIAGGMISCWVQLRAVEVVLEEIAAEFDGADPLKPGIRDELEETKSKLAPRRGLTVIDRIRLLFR